MTINATIESPKILKVEFYFYYFREISICLVFRKPLVFKLRVYFYFIMHNEFCFFRIKLQLIKFVFYKVLKNVCIIIYILGGKIMIFFKNLQELFKEIEIGIGLRSNENFFKEKIVRIKSYWAFKTIIRCFFSMLIFSFDIRSIPSSI